MSKFYFFTDLDLLTTQSAAEAFGPAGSSGGNDLFQVTSLHASSADANAYAVCDGIVFIQQNSADATLVNLILKPMAQPPFAFPKIKFIIYRGIRKDSLINGTDIAASSNNDLTQSLWDSQTARNTSAGTSDNPPQEALGIDITGTGSVEDQFYRTGVTYQFPVVRAGWSIGTFTSAGFGLDIMVESIGFDPTLDLVRNDTNVIQVTSLSASPTQPETFEHWHDKEAILNYIDPCAFYGSFYNSKFKAKSSTSGNSGDTKKSDSIYDDVLVKFNNKNRVYLDIRNEYNFSFNYFKNYGTDIQIAFDDTSSLTTQNYYTSGWPLLAVDNSDFPTGNTSSGTNTLRIAMPDGSGDNTLPLMYISTGYLKGLYPREPTQKNKFIDLAVTSGLTDEIALSAPNRTGQTDTASISCYIKLKYNKRFDSNNIQPSSGTVIRAQNYLDNIFAPFSIKIPFGGTSNLKIAIYDEELYVDTNQELGVDFIAKVGNSDDGSNYVFCAFSKILRSENGSNTTPLSISSEASDTNTGFYNYITEKINNITVRKSNLELSTDIEEYLDLVQSEPLEDIFSNSSTEDLISIGLNKSDLTNVDLSGFQDKYRIYLGLANKITDYDDIGQPYTSADIVLRGFELSSGILQLKELITTLKIYYHGNNV